MTSNNMILVTGVGRSGTSAVAGILYYMGVFMGRRFIPPNGRNPRGYFEDRTFVDLDIRVIQGKKEPRVIHNMIKKRNKNHDVWGVKDPRISELLEIYLTYKPKIIWCTRDKEEILRSLKETYDEGTQVLYGRRRAEYEKHLSDYKNKMIIDLDNLRQNKKVVIKQIADFVGVEPDEGQLKRAENFIYA